ncbi:hypothetical protein [Pseudoxanthomonas indica]|uniref:Lipoprotein n=1 Tax=Pseudoxanthomonas indica TaxID=428993 RepID=A0A1T5K1C5_9GAMM|nr:hypothetical protein [Pseudoxanthomonas indica]GGD45832.1 hypothetical protein GCM10007235_17280 [Pseudoxanthomonas indica]SKC57423.1 hypothetical protein SAMN06296058_1267 [Pseudoxanthomonas indica]
MKPASFAVLLIAFGVAGCSEPASPERKAEATRKATTESKPRDPRKAISEYVFEPYDKREYPKLSKKLGSAWPRIQPLREAAALRFVKSGRCDFVELAEVSESRSTKQNITVFVDCRNRERLYVSEDDLNENRALSPQSDRVISQSVAIDACADAAKSRATFPSLVNAHTWAGARFSSDKTTGGARVLLDFEATNALGVELPYTANCTFPVGGPAEITIIAR